MQSILFLKAFWSALFFGPIKKLFDEFFIKSMLATIISLFAVPDQFLGAFIMMWLFDLIIGTIKSTWGKKQRFDIDKFLFSIGKFGGYSIFLMGASFFANAFEWDEIQRWAFAFVILTEFMSIIRHVFGTKAGQVLGGLRKIIQSKTDVTFNVIGDAFEEKKSD